MVEKQGGRSRRAILTMELTTFDLPPSGEVLVLAKRAPIGPEAGKRMLDTVAPGQFELVQLEDDLIEAIFVKKHLFLRADRESLIRAIVEETRGVLSDQDMIRIKCDVTIGIRREL